MTAVQAEWTDDVLPGYRQHTLALGTDPDGEGELFATLVRTTDSIPSSSVVLAVHGYTDYFFNTELADHFAARGWRFYGLDSRRCGRSWREGQTPHFTTDLIHYDRELEGALAIIGAENPAARVLVYGHSTGGLVVSLWLDRVRSRGDTAALKIAGLVLNSPFLDLNGPRILRTRATSTAIGAASRVRATRVVRGAGSGGYGLTLHRAYHGEFDYTLTWKPIGGFPITVGWTPSDAARPAFTEGLTWGCLISCCAPITASPRPPRRSSCSAGTRCSMSRTLPAGRAAWVTEPPVFRWSTPSTTCFCRCPNRAPQPTPNWIAGLNSCLPRSLGFAPERRH